MFHVYVLRSEMTGRLYTGFTSDLTQRLGQHNHGVTKSMKNRGSWKLTPQGGFRYACGGDAKGAVPQERAGV